MWLMANLLTATPRISHNKYKGAERSVHIKGVYIHPGLELDMTQYILQGSGHFPSLVAILAKCYMCITVILLQGTKYSQLDFL